MDALTTLVAALLSALRVLVATDVCPGGWAWATSALGVGVGLLPTVGATTVALLRRRIGSRYDAGRGLALASIGLLSAGLLPLLVFVAAGNVFASAALGRDVAGLTGAGDLGDRVCVVGAQSDYLGAGSVADAFDPTAPVRFGLALFALALLPLLVALLVGVQARLALRRGPGWPSKFFWLPALALALLTSGVPAGTAGQLWLGASGGAMLGVAVLLVAGKPSWATVRRSLAEAPQPAARPAATPFDRSGPPSEAAAPPVGGPSGSGRRWTDKLAERFAARGLEPLLIVPEVRATALAPAPLPADPSPRPPTLVAPLPATAGGTARFRLVRRLGSGGFGRVWLAHDAVLGHPVALKAAHAPDTETEERIRREAQALSTIRHPHCVRIHDLLHARSDAGLAELDGMVIVMEYLQGSPLGEFVRSRGPLDDIAAARAWAGLAGALEAAHSRGVLHRDVKPANVVLDPGGLAHLIDFGIARRTGDSTLTMAGFVLGTPDYLAPEVAGGGRATPASDAWQLAATLSFALTGYPPRGGFDDAISGLRAAAAGARLRHLPPGSAHLALLRASMDTDPARRPTPAVVGRALEDWLHRVGARPDGPITARSSTR